MMNENLNTLPEWLELKMGNNQGYFSCFMRDKYINVGIYHQQFNHEILKKLAQICVRQGLEQNKHAWLQGENVDNMPSQIWLRGKQGASFTPSQRPQYQQTFATRQKIKYYADLIRQRKWLGYSGKPITDIVNIGIGGSDLGPRLCHEAFAYGQKSPINCHFISDADTIATQTCLQNLNPETTLFLVSSKSFTTDETLMNAGLALKWINHSKAMQNHFIAITAHPEYAKQKGFVHVLEIWDWVIGRYSCCSAINFINIIQYGYDAYESFLQGAHEMDKHFLTQSCMDNLPILMALIGIWNINFLNIPSHLLLIYHSKLRLLVDYVQQLDMESNGKSVNQWGKKIDYATGPIIWGGLGNQAQHSYYQHLAQSQQQIAIDFINVKSENRVLNQFCLARKKVLHQGIQSPLGAKHSIKQQISINHIQLHNMAPESLGALIALYEHKIFTQAWLWNINPFDQPGVEAAKQEMLNNPELKDYF